MKRMINYVKSKSDLLSKNSPNLGKTPFHIFCSHNHLSNRHEKSLKDFNQEISAHIAIFKFQISNFEPKYK